MADPGDKDYHRRNVIVDEDLVLRALQWHGGQGSMLYSFGSTALGDYVSPSMIDAAVSELEYAKKGARSKERRELDNLIGDLDMVARDSWSSTTEEMGLGDVDSGYATWLMEENPAGVTYRTLREARAAQPLGSTRKRLHYTKLPSGRWSVTLDHPPKGAVRLGRGKHVWKMVAHGNPRAPAALTGRQRTQARRTLEGQREVARALKRREKAEARGTRRQRSAPKRPKKNAKKKNPRSVGALVRKAMK